MKNELFDGKILQAAFRGAEKYIEKHIDELNILNVFPVPDGDTGVNMLSNFSPNFLKTAKLKIYNSGTTLL